MDVYVDAGGLCLHIYIDFCYLFFVACGCALYCNVWSFCVSVYVYVNGFSLLRCVIMICLLWQWCIVYRYGSCVLMWHVVLCYC